MMHGVIAAVPTPIDALGVPQKKPFLEHCRWVLVNGANGLNILGSTGEANSFDKQTRKTIMRWAAAELEPSQLMAGTGTPSLAETIDLTAFADDLGYSAALVLPPYYYKPLSDEGLYDWYAHLHWALGDRKIPVYFYNFPQMTGLTIPIPLIAKLNKTWPERFNGVKDSSGDLTYCRQLAMQLPNFSVFPSSEVTLGEAEVSGFAGCISATVNQTVSMCANVWAGRKSPDKKQINAITNLRNGIASYELIPSIKYLVSLRTGLPEWENLLPPLAELSKNRKAELEQLEAQILLHLIA